MSTGKAPAKSGDAQMGPHSSGEKKITLVSHFLYSQQIIRAQKVRTIVLRMQIECSLSK